MLASKCLSASLVFTERFLVLWLIFYCRGVILFKKKYKTTYKTIKYHCSEIAEPEALIYFLVRFFDFSEGWKQKSWNKVEIRDRHRLGEKVICIKTL